MKKISILLILVVTATVCFAQSGRYTIEMSKPAQVIWGLGVELQNDAIGSGNRGLPDEAIAVPNNLVPSERKRLYNDVLKGFRYCRLAMGLYFRGLDAEKKRIIERYPNQLKDLKELIRESGMEGISMEYWSPAPYWKSTNSYLGGTLKQFDEPFLKEFGSALVDDIGYFKKNGVNVSIWGLQNEPGVGDVGTLTLSSAGPQSYSHCVYSPDQYIKTFRVVAPMVRAALPASAVMIAESNDGQSGKIGTLLRQDSSLTRWVDAWVYHRIGANSSSIIKESPKFRANTLGKPVFQNEFEYQKPTNDSLFVNTAQSVMNWLTFANSPTWFWLHVLKPTYNAEASGYSLGFWRPQDDNDMSKQPQIKKGHWDYNQPNFNALAGFLKHMPWDSRRIEVTENQVRDDNRIMSYLTPKKKLVIVLTNRSGKPFTYEIAGTGSKSFTGYRYTPKERNTLIGKSKGQNLKITLPDNAVEFWVEG